MEPGDHRRAGRADAAVRGSGPRLRLRDRRPRRHPGPVPAADPVAARAWRSLLDRARLAQRARTPRPVADAAGDARARADQPQPADQLAVRDACLGRRAGRDRQGVSDLPAAPGPVLDLDRDGAVPDAVEARRPRTTRGPARDDVERRPPDPAAADPERGADGGAGRADHAAALPARRVRRGGDRSRRDRARLVVDLAAVPGCQPALLAHLLRPPTAVGDDGARGREHGRQRRGGIRALRAVRDRRDRDRDRRRDACDDDRPGLDPAWPARRDRGPPARRGGRAHAGCRGRARRAVLPRLAWARRGARALADRAAVWLLRVPEARQVARLVRTRRG